MRITYRQLKLYLEQLSKSQLDCDVTLEDANEDECYPVGFRIADEEHDSLEVNHPVIYLFLEPIKRATNEEVWLHIEELKAENGFGEVG